MDCITPTNPNGISPGESLDIFQLLKKEESLLRPEVAREIDFKGFEYISRVPVMRDLQAKTNILLMKAQISSKDKELDDIVAMAKRPGTESFTGRIIPGTRPPRYPGAARGTSMEKTTRIQKHPSANPKAAKNLPGGRSRRTVPTLFDARSPAMANGSLIKTPHTTTKGPGTTAGSVMAGSSMTFWFRPYHTRLASRKLTNGDVWAHDQDPLSGKTKDWGAKSRSKSQKSTTPGSGAPYKLLQMTPFNPRAPKGLSKAGASEDGGSSRVGVRKS